MIMYIRSMLLLGVEGACDAKPVSDISVAAGASSDYNELHTKCKAYQEELTEVHKPDKCIQLCNIDVQC